MSLKSWWTLNGNTLDNTKNNNNLTNSGCVISNEGKIGKCYQFNGGYMSSVNPITNNSFTICAWIKTTDDTNKAIFSSRTVLGSGISLFILGKIIRFDTGTHQWTTKISIDNNIWYHVAFVCTPTSKSVYINGTLSESIITNTNIQNIYTNCYIGSSPTNNIDHGNFFKGFINDVRVYDNILSAKEIYDISLGKVLHYSFNSQVEATVNILPYPTVNQTYSVPGSYKPGWNDSAHPGAIAVSNWGNGYNSGVGNASTQYHAYWIYDNDGYTPICCYRDIPNPNVNNTRPGWLGVDKSLGTPASLGWTVGTPITISVLAKTDTKGKGLRFGIYHMENGVNNFNGSINTVLCTSVGEWEILKYTFTVTSAWELDKNASIFIYGHSAGAQGTSYWKYAQLETKDHASPITNGTNTPIIYDTSGFNNIAILSPNTTPQWVSDSVINRGCYLFKGAQYITLPQFLFNNSTQEWSVCAWVKLTDNTTDCYLDNINYGNRLIHGSTKKPLLYVNSGANDCYVYGSEVQTNIWFHITFVYSKPKQICSIYINGSLDKSSTNINPTDVPSGFYTAHNIGVSLKGYICDYRVYTKALDNFDIQNIYNCNIEIDNNGNFNCSSYNISSEISFNKKGIAESNDISEAFAIGKTYVLDDSNTSKIILGEWNSTSKKMQYKGETAFTILGEAFPTAWNSNINIEKYRHRVINNFVNNKVIYCNTLYEN